jgi:hypothetical protein
MKLFKTLALASALLFAAFIVFSVYTARQACFYQAVIGTGLQHQLGFTHGSPYILAGHDRVEVFSVHPRPDGAFAAAGVHDGDIVLSHRITDFYRALHEHRGSRFSFRVTDGGDGAPITQRPVRTVTLDIAAQQQTR